MVAGEHDDQDFLVLKGSEGINPPVNTDQGEIRGRISKFQLGGILGDQNHDSHLRSKLSNGQEFVTIYPVFKEGIMLTPVSGSSQNPVQEVSERRDLHLPFALQRRTGFDPTRWYLLTAGVSLSIPLVMMALPAVRRALSAESEVLKAALGKIKPTQIGEDVTYLASDALKGRGTPSEGLTLAGKHVVDRIKAHGWQPGGPGGSYEHKYTLLRAKLDRQKTGLVFGIGGSKRSLVFGDDYFYGSLSSRGASDIDLPDAGTLVFGGSGRAEDLAAVDVTGKWLVCRDSGFPASIRRENAIAKGARGIILLPPEGRLSSRYLRRLQSRLALAKEKGEVLSSPDHTIDEIVLSPKAAKRLLDRLHGGSRSSSGLSLGRPLTAGRHPVRVEVTQTSPVGLEGVTREEASNFVGFFPGKDPERSKEVIIISAHLDHLGERWGKIYPGADDNASGSSALLALAEAIPALQHEHSVLLIWTTGEELGLLGSEAWVRNPWLPAGTRPWANINIDMVGRNAAEELLVTPTSRLGQYYNGIVRRIERHAPAEGITTLKSGDEYWTRSDQYNFASILKIPAAFITNDTHPDYHRTTDIASKIKPETIARRTRLIVRVLDDLRGSLD